MEPDLILEAIRRRRTIRRYTDEEIDDETVRTLLTAGMSAPSMLNRRPWQFVVIRDPETRRQIVQHLRAPAALAGAPLFLAALADVRKSPAWRLDLSGAVENILLSATALELGAAWISALDSTLAEQAEASLRQALDIPTHLTPFAFIPIGRPAESPPPHTPDDYFSTTRIHYDAWGNRPLRSRARPLQGNQDLLSGGREEILQAFLRRRTARKFLKKRIPKGALEGLLQMAMFAPSRLGQRPWHFVVLSDEELKRKLLRDLHVDRAYEGAPALVAICADRVPGHQWDIDAGAAAQNLLLAAAALGLGSAWLANPAGEAWAAARDWFCRATGCPEEVSLVALIALGHAADHLPAHTAAEVYDESAVHFERLRSDRDTERGAGRWADALGDRAGWDAVDRATRTRARLP